MRTGYRLALGVAAVTIVLAVVLLVAELLGARRDASKYGQIPLPGRESVSLPAGDVIIYYGERPDASFPLRVPPNLRLRVRTTNGQELLGSTPYLTGQFHDGDYGAVPWPNSECPRRAPTKRSRQPASRAPSPQSSASGGMGRGASATSSSC